MTPTKSQMRYHKYVGKGKPHPAKQIAKAHRIRARRRVERKHIVKQDYDNIIGDTKLNWWNIY